MTSLFTTDSRRHLYAIDGGNTDAPPKRNRPALFHSTQTVVAVAAVKGARKYDVVQREFSPAFCSEWEPA